jgi:hypothetical protein
LLIGPYAEIHFASTWRHSGELRKHVQALLDEVEEWDPAETDIVVETVEIAGKTFPNPTIPIPFAEGQLQQFFWAVHRSHTARQPGLSPFAKLNSQPDRTNLMTLELAGTPDKPVLARLYPGEEMMPLPWQSSIRNARSGADKIAAQAYWRTHAFVAMGNYCRGTVTGVMPVWYQTL